MLGLSQGSAPTTFAMTPRIVSSTFKDGQYHVIVDGLESWEQAERVAAFLAQELRKAIEKNLYGIREP